MKRQLLSLAGLIVMLTMVHMSATDAAPLALRHGRFESVRVYSSIAPAKSFALLLAEAGGNSAAQSMAEALVEKGALVAVVESSELFENRHNDPADCISVDGDLENLSHFVQAYFKLPTYFAPILVAQHSAASLAYVTLAQAPPAIFSGALLVDFCPHLRLNDGLCEDSTLSDHASDKGMLDLHPARESPTPWIALQGASDETCPVAAGFIHAAANSELRVVPDAPRIDVAEEKSRAAFQAAYSSLAVGSQKSPLVLPEELASLPISEVLAQKEGGAFAVLLSGDGGWAGIDKAIAEQLARDGIAVVGFDSLRYFWSPRTPAELARDLERIIDHYTMRWEKNKVILIGYSQGADVLPFAINRMPSRAVARISLAALLSLGHTAQFEFHLSEWWSEAGGLPIAPEAMRLRTNTVCIYGAEDEDTLCPQLNSAAIRKIRLPGAHHFDGNYSHIASLIENSSGHNNF